ncbi:SEC-C domain-containing protein [candidate division KSB1 bacterium]|nr:SEC-C domain-containing protein [candidate division KSB1 bacterium]
MSEARQAVDEILLSAIPFDDFLNIFVFGLINLHLPADQAPIHWRSEEFLRDLERIFNARPTIGQNEIRSIRLTKLVAILRDWIQTLDLPRDETVLRHRIVGYFGPLRLVDAVIAERLFEHEAGSAQELTTADAAYFKSLFNHDFQVATTGQNERPIVQLFRQAREAYMARVRHSRQAYDDAMIAGALSEELIEAAIHTVIDDILTSAADQTAAQKELSWTLENMFLTKPMISIPQQRDEQTIAVFKEDVVAWGHAFYKMYSDRMERFRQEELSSEIVSDSVIGMIDDTIYAMIDNVLGGDDVLDAAQISRLESECRLIFRQTPRIADESLQGMDPNKVMDLISEWAKNLYYQRVRELGRELVTRMERYYVLEKIDENWRQHLHGVDELREGIGLRGYGQKDPLLEYKREAFVMFERTIDSINRETVSTLFKVFDVGGEVEEQQLRRLEPQSFTTSHSQVEVFRQVMSEKAPARKPAPGPTEQRTRTVVKTKSVGRNEPCPCGSGKKYKNCCGRHV